MYNSNMGAVPVVCCRSTTWRNISFSTFSKCKYEGCVVIGSLVPSFPKPYMVNNTIAHYITSKAGNKRNSDPNYAAEINWHDVNWSHKQAPLGRERKKRNAKPIQ